MSNSNHSTVVLRGQNPSLPPDLSTCLLTAIPKCSCLSDPCFNFDVTMKSYTKRYVGDMD